MYISVNKKTNTRKPVKYSALSSGTISHVWADEDSFAPHRRTNRIDLHREIKAVAPKIGAENLDA